MRRRLLIVLAFAICAPVVGVLRVNAQSFTLEQVMSSPFPSELTVSKRGDKIAWAFDAEGKRNIWIAEGPAFTARQLTHYNSDDGQELTDLLFSPNGNTIAYVRGGDANQAGEVPNPTSDPEGAKQETWVVDVRTARVTRIGLGKTPIFSPAGDQVEYLRGGSIWTAPVLGGKESKMFEIRGAVNSAPQWSPDGSQLAFASSRGDHGFIVVYDKRANSFRFISPSVDRDVAPRWSPDGRRIAFIRLFSVTDTFSNDRERLQPWAIEVADAQTGVAKEIWHSGGADNDSYAGFGGDFWQWVAGDRILFSSEKDGWAHLYAISSGGGGLSDLTPGNYEVENASLSPDKSFVIFAANKNDIDRRHLWRVSVDGGPPEQITKGDGIEMAPMLFDNGRRIAFFHSSAHEPYLPFTTSIGGAELKTLAPQALPRNFPSAQLVTPEQVIFKAADGTEIHGQLFKPAATSGKSPALVFMHGGPSRQMLLGWHYLFYYHNAYAMNQYLASRGYLVLSVNYRSGIGYGRAFRTAQHRGARGASEYQDVVAAGKYLRDRDDVDKKRIGLWGGSYGGYLTALGLARNSDIFAAGVDFHGVHDWSMSVAGLRVPTDTSDRVRIARESSPISSVDKWKSPVLLIHGDDDRNVEFAQTVNLVRRLRANGVQFEELIFPDEIHDFLRHQDWLRAYHAGAEFFDKHLK